MTFLEWAKSKNACGAAIAWIAQQPDQSIQSLISECPCGDWILWAYQKAGYDFDVLAPVAYNAVNRALGYAADELDRDGVKHGLRDIVVVDRESAGAAAACAAACAAAWAAAACAAACDAACADAAYAAAYAAYADACAAARKKEHKTCADDCRRLLPPLVIEGVE